MTALTSALPRKSSRTRTQAVIVPSTPLIRTTMNAAPNVSLRAATASGLDTICQKPCAPLFFDSQRSAARGGTTTGMRKVEKAPTDRAVLARPPARFVRALAGADAATLLMGGSSDGPLDPDHATRVGVEPDAVHVAPAAEEPIPDVERRPGVVLLAPAREVRPLQDRLHDWPVAVGGEDRLLFRRMCVRDERLGRARRVLDRDHRQLDQHRRLGNDERARLTGGERGVGLALVRDEDVALAGEERVGGVGAGRGLRDDGLERLRQE